MPAPVGEGEKKECFDYFNKQEGSINPTLFDELSVTTTH